MSHTRRAKLFATVARVKAIAAICLSSSLLLGACSKSVPTRLDDTMIRQFVEMGARAVERRDVETVCGQLADSAEVSIVEVRFSSSDVKRYDKPQWCDVLRQSYAQIPAGMPYEVAIDITSLEVAADGRTAQLRMDVIEAVSLGGQVIRVNSRQSGAVALVGGKPVYTSISARVSAGQ